MAKGKYRRWLEPDGLPLLEGWARSGLTGEQIVHDMGTTVKTLYVRKSACGEICETLKKDKEIVDIWVESALLKRALGYEYMEERMEINERDGRKITQTMKTIPPDTTAQIFWLRDRRPDQWRDRPVEGAPETNQTEDGVLTRNLKEPARGL